MEHKYFVVVDHEDPGAEFDDWSTAAAYVTRLQAKFPDARIVSSAFDYEDDSTWELDAPWAR